MNADSLRGLQNGLASTVLEIICTLKKYVFFIKKKKWFLKSNPLNSRNSKVKAFLRKP